MGLKKHTVPHFEPGWEDRLWTELSQMFTIGWPVVVTFFCQYGLNLTNVIFAGHLGAVQLAAISIATLFCNMTGNSIGYGLNSAIDTICSQAFGAKNYPLVGVVTQRAILIMLTISVPITALWLVADRILLLIGQDPQVAALAASYTQMATLGLVPYFIFESLKRFLQAQGITRPSMYIAMAQVPLAIATNYVFTYTLGWGLRGSALATVLASYLELTMLVAYMWRTKVHAKCWGPWTRDCLRGWATFFRYGVPGMVMICSEWWAFETLAIMAGLIGTLSLATTSLVSAVLAFFFMLPLGCGIAGSVRVGHYLGAGESDSARFAGVVTILVVIGLGSIDGFIFLAAKIPIGYVFTSDVRVIALNAAVLPFIACTHYFNAVQGVCSGIIRGSGRQSVGAWVNSIGYYCIGIPLSAVFSFYWNWDIVGLWAGLTLGIVFSSTWYMFYISNFDWDEEARRAYRLVHHHLKEESTSAIDVTKNPGPDKPLDDSLAGKSDESESVSINLNPQHSDQVLSS